MLKTDITLKSTILKDGEKYTFTVGENVTLTTGVFSIKLLLSSLMERAIL